MTILVLAFFTKCNSPTATNNAAEKAAHKLANNIDDSSLTLLKQFNFSKRGEIEFWQKTYIDDFLYSFSHKIIGDTIEMTVHRPHNFKRDFHTTFRFDTSKYHEFRFLKLQDTIVKIVSAASHFKEDAIDTTIPIKLVFPEADPFAVLSKLTTLKNKFHFIGTMYGGDAGDFIVFWMSPQFKLTYLPDSSNMNQMSKKYWLDDFNNGKLVKTHWSLQKVYE